MLVCEDIPLMIVLKVQNVSDYEVPSLKSRAQVSEAALHLKHISFYFEFEKL
jgi:hypothetical protein